MKVKASEAVPGQWYENHIGTKCLCIESGRVYCQNLGFFTLPLHELLTHLPDCTGWDWQPPKPEKRYRAFASFEEWWPHRERWWRFGARVTQGFCSPAEADYVFKNGAVFLNDDGSDCEPFGVGITE
jgi:hypothetical protein